MNFELPSTRATFGFWEKEREVGGRHNTILLAWVHVYHHCSTLGLQVLVKGLGSTKSWALEAVSATIYHLKFFRYTALHDKVTPCSLCTIELTLHLVKVVMVGVWCILALLWLDTEPFYFLTGFFYCHIFSSARVLELDQAIWKRWWVKHSAIRACC